MNVYFKLRDGSTVEASEALAGTTLRDGYGVRTAMSFMDGARGERTIPVGYVADGSMLISDAQDAYEARISSAWRGRDAAPLPRWRPSPIAYTIGALADSQAAYEKRLSEAWRGE